MAINKHLAHRQRLPGRQLFPDPGLFARIGGRPAVSTMVDALYDRIEADDQLRPKFTGAIAMERENQKMFFEEWLGGEPLYSMHLKMRSLREVHGHIHISKREANQWLAHFESALKDACQDGAACQEFLAALRPLALALVNEPRNARQGEHRCFRGKPWKAALKAAERGKLDAIQASVEQTPSILNDIGPELLCAAARRGQLEVAQWLLKKKVDPNQPSPGELLLATPLCIAQHKRKLPMVELLGEHGALDDVFTQTSLGDLNGVQRWLELDASLLNASDPGDDVAGMPPLCYAVFCNHQPIAEMLLDVGAEIGKQSTVLVRWASEHGNLELTKRLLDAGADATRIGVGRWVLDNEISQLLMQHGADVTFESDPWSSWIWKSCTGNNSQRDDPDYVSAIVACGADVNAIHPYWRVGALHFAAKAGFVKTIQVLLAAGADPNLRDGKLAETPLFYVFKSGKSVDRRAVAKLLLDAGADPDMANDKGTPPPV